LPPIDFRVRVQSESRPVNSVLALMQTVGLLPQPLLRLGEMCLAACHGHVRSQPVAVMTLSEAPS
jgi:hypothetical protein